MLNDIFNNIAKCRYCDRSFCFDVAENKSSRRGLASSISATCKYCGSSHGSMTSNSVPAGYEVNLRFVYAAARDAPQKLSLNDFLINNVGFIHYLKFFVDIRVLEELDSTKAVIYFVDC
ncbi:hypothetical protein TNCT_689581 [Trichonephila clavata]|uniref:Uncharacterized protein n=1 Tax=Trichonephila clavata TaxID=2740835 RepID=A0A8X6I414_TRICU|nr:hypothetical protein TNCT_689581 [Trichonephila clavata]